MRRAPILILIVGALAAFPAVARASDAGIYQDLVIQSIFVLGPVVQLQHAKTPAQAETLVGRIVTAAATAQRKIGAEHASTPAGARCKARGVAIFAGYVKSGKAIQAGIRDGSKSEIDQALRSMQSTGVSLIAAEKTCAKLK